MSFFKDNPLLLNFVRCLDNGQIYVAERLHDVGPLDKIGIGEKIKGMISPGLTFAS